MSWNVQAVGHIDNGPDETEKVQEFARKVVELAKESDIGLSYVSASIPNVGAKTFFAASQGIDVTEEADATDSGT